MKISACTIVKNEEKNIEKSIRSYKEYVDEIVIVDTGSTDKTAEIAKSLGAKVVNFEWTGDFSAAKNFAIDNVTGEYIIFLDADEFFVDESAQYIREAIKISEKNNCAGIACKFINFDQNGSILDVIACLRIFVKKPNIRYKRKIHEMLYDINQGIPVVSIYTDKLVIHHHGYTNKIIKSKVNRNKELLEQNYVEGNAETLDYFYLGRENLQENPEYARQFFDMFFSAPDYKEVIKSINIGNSIYELRLKLESELPQEYSMEKRLKSIEECQREDEGNPVYEYYKYQIYKDYDDKKAFEALNKAIEQDPEYEQKGKQNSFYTRKASGYIYLGIEALKLNDNIAAMDCFTKSIMTKVREPEALKGLMYIISNEKPEDIVLFLNSLFDTETEEALRFIVETLRLTPYHQVFLYYFVKWNKKFNEIDVSYFTSRLITNKCEDVAKQYMDIFMMRNDVKAMELVTAALIAGNCKEFYENIKMKIPSSFSRILMAFFNNEELNNINNEDIGIFESVFSEIAYIADEEIIDRFKKILGDKKEKAYDVIIGYYFRNYNYNLALREANKLMQEGASDEYNGVLYSVLGYSYFKLNEFEKSKEYLAKAIDTGDMKSFVLKVYEYIITNTESTLEEQVRGANYKKILNKWQGANKLIKMAPPENEPEYEKLSPEEFANEIKTDAKKITSPYMNDLYNCAQKYLTWGKLVLAEEYYKLLIKGEYKNKAICYYRLGYIYNELGNIDLSIYCYQSAFTINLKLASNILDRNHKNYFYIFGKREEDRKETCPICGEKSERKYCFSHIEDYNLTYEDTPMSIYRHCKKCNHIFAENNRKINENFDAEEIDESRISEAYTFIKDEEDKISNRIVVVDLNSEISMLLKDKGYEVNHFNLSLEKTEKLEKFIEDIKNSMDKETTLVMNIFDIESLFNKKRKPTWAKPRIKNAFSEKSIKLLLEQNGIETKDIYKCRYVKGKMIVIATV